MLRTIVRCVNKTAPYAVCVRELMAFDVEFVHALDGHGAMVPNCTNFTNLIRSRMGRAHVIAETDFLLPFYSLFDALVSLVHILLWATSFSSLIVGVTNASVFSFLFVYLGLLVRDLDDPFGYPKGYLERCLDEERWLPLSVSYAMIDSSSIDFSILVVSFNSMLNAELERIGEPVSRTANSAAFATTAAGAAATNKSAGGGGGGGTDASALGAGNKGSDNVLSVSDMTSVVP